MRGRFIIDTGPNCIYVYLREHASEDIVDEEQVMLDSEAGELVSGYMDKDGRLLGVEIVLPGAK